MFSAPILTALTGIGWSPTRRRPVTSLVLELEQRGVYISSYAVPIMEQLVGLEYLDSKRSIAFDPVDAAGFFEDEDLPLLAPIFGDKVTPIAFGCGWIYSVGDNGHWLLLPESWRVYGVFANIDAMLRFAIFGEKSYFQYDKLRPNLVPERYRLALSE